MPLTISLSCDTSVKYGPTERERERESMSSISTNFTESELIEWIWSLTMPYFIDRWMIAIEWLLRVHTFVLFVIRFSSREHNFNQIMSVQLMKRFQIHFFFVFFFNLILSPRAFFLYLLLSLALSHRCIQRAIYSFVPNHVPIVNVTIVK